VIGGIHGNGGTPGGANGVDGVAPGPDAIVIV
jgi:hypothetical protein